MRSITVALFVSLIAWPLFGAETCEFQGVRFSPSLKEFLTQFPVADVHISSGTKMAGYQTSDVDFEDNPTFDSMKIYSRDDSIRQVNLQFRSEPPNVQFKNGKIVSLKSDRIDHRDVVKKLTQQYGQPFAIGGYCEEALKIYLVEYRTKTCRIIHSYGGSCPETEGEVFGAGQLYIEALPRTDDDLTYTERIQFLKQ